MLTSTWRYVPGLFMRVLSFHSVIFCSLWQTLSLSQSFFQSFMLLKKMVCYFSFSLGQRWADAVACWWVDYRCSFSWALNFVFVSTKRHLSVSDKKKSVLMHFSTRFAHLYLFSGVLRTRSCHQESSKSRCQLHNEGQGWLHRGRRLWKRAHQSIVAAFLMLNALENMDFWDWLWETIFKSFNILELTENFGVKWASSLLE